jgi:type II secretory pathway pseudopilin PulG
MGRWWRDGPLREAGMTLVEVVVAASLTVAVVPIIGPVMISSLRAANKVETESQALDDLRLQLYTVSRELRGATCVAAPAANGASDHTLRFQTNTSGASYWVTYTVGTDGVLTRTRDGRDPQTVATSLTERTATFKHVATPRRSIEIRFVVQPDDAKSRRELSTTIAGRNAWRTAAC